MKGFSLLREQIQDTLDQDKIFLLDSCKNKTEILALKTKVRDIKVKFFDFKTKKTSFKFIKRLSHRGVLYKKMRESRHWIQDDRFSYLQKKNLIFIFLKAFRSKKLSKTQVVRIRKRLNI